MNSDYALNFQCGVVQSQSHVSTTGFEAHNFYLLLKTTRVRGMKVNNNKTDWHSIAQILPRATEKDTFQGERKILVMKRTRSINEFKKKPECFCLFTDGGFMGSFVYCELLGWRKSVGVKTNRPRLLRRSSLEIKSRRRSGNATCGIMRHCDRITSWNAHRHPSMHAWQK